MKVYKVKSLGKQIVSIDEYYCCVNSCTRNVVLTGVDDDETFEVPLIGNDALLPLKEGQKVLVDLRWDHHKMFGECYDEYYVKSITPLDDDVRIEYVQDWTTRLV